MIEMLAALYLMVRLAWGILRPVYINVIIRPERDHRLARSKKGVHALSSPLQYLQQPNLFSQEGEDKKEKTNWQT